MFANRALLSFAWAMGVAALYAAGTKSEETLTRGVVAVVNAEGKVYIGWRLLKTDPANRAR
jgi:hypothetical protein